jgi:hypothetical protein
MVTDMEVNGMNMMEERLLKQMKLKGIDMTGNHT